MSVLGVGAEFNPKIENLDSTGRTALLQIIDELRFDLAVKENAIKILGEELIVARADSDMRFKESMALKEIVSDWEAWFIKFKVLATDMIGRKTL